LARKYRLSFYAVGWSLVLLFLLTGPMYSASLIRDAVIDVVPKVGVFISAEDIVRARQQATTKSWAATVAAGIFTVADEWVEKPDSYIYDLVPPKGAIFAYGETGCPIDGSDWGSFGRNGVADFSRPFVLKCPNGTLIDVNDPDSGYYDAGLGITINGVKYYLRGIWNSYVVDQLLGWGDDTGIVHKLAYAYALSGDKKYAEKAAVIMDALATLQPTTIGPRDFTTSATAIQGRFHWLTSIVFRARMHLVNAYDLVYNALDKSMPSPTYPGRTLISNIEEGLFLDYVFGEYNLRDGNLTSLHNHEADNIRGLLAVGMLLGIPDYIRWGINGVTAFLDNTIDRDGMYYETSLSYSGFSQTVFLSMAELAYNYSPDKYEGTGFPERSEFPYNANFYDHPKLQRFLVGYRDRVDAIGFRPAIGDAGPNLNKTNNLTWVLDASERVALEHLATRVSDPVQRQQFADYLIESSNGNPDNFRSTSWLLFHAQDLTYSAPVVSTAAKQRNSESQLLGSTGLGLLRSGKAPSMRAALMRGGSTLPHGHDDVLGLSIYARGFDISTEIGYGIASTPVHLGWGSTGIAHNLVVVNKGLQRNYGLLQVGPGGDTLAFVSNPGVSGMEMDAYQMFQASDGVKQYQRGVWQIDISANDAYWLDVFRITGGNTHDYSFHVGTQVVNFQGVQMAAMPDVWTLHGVDNPNASIDDPGKSWGERITTGENIKDLGVPSEGVQQARNWSPYPGNGYGFIYDLQGGTPGSTWSATWLLPDMSLSWVRLTMVPQGGAQQVYRGFGPDLSGKNKYAYVIGRRQGVTPLQSRFVSVIQTYSGMPLVSDVVELPQLKGHSQSVALKVQLRGSTGFDYILSNPKAGIVLQANANDTLLETDALFAMVRITNGEIVQWHIVGGSYMRVGTEQLTVTTGEYNGVIVGVDYAKRQLVTSAALPLASLEGSTITFSNPAYAKNTAYTLAGVTDLGNSRYGIELGDSVLELARTSVDAVAGSLVTLKAPLPTGFEYSIDTRALHGKLIVNTRTGSSAIIRSLNNIKSVRLEAAVQDWKPGDNLVIYDVRVGDTFNLLTSASLIRDGSEWSATGSVPVQLQAAQ
jgi:hypothetical protein